jgi:hypothetical protein
MGWRKARKGKRRTYHIKLLHVDTPTYPPFLSAVYILAKHPGMPKMPNVHSACVKVSGSKFMS